MARPVPPSEIIRFIDKFFPDSDKDPLPGDGGLLDGLVRMVEKLEPLMLPSNDRSRARLLAATSHIRHQVDRWANSGGKDKLPRIPQLGKKSAVAVLCELLKHCHDTIVPEETPGLEFIEDETYRMLLRRDVAEMEACLKWGQWKAATVLGGALIEAILLEKLRKPKEYVNAPHYKKIVDKNPRKKAPDYWDLHDCLKIAQDLSVIDKDAFDVADKAREFRNFIHPGRSKRKKKTCTPGFAHSVKGGLFLVIENLEKRHR